MVAMRHGRTLGRDDGLTILELVMTLAILAAAFGVAYQYLYHSFAGWDRVAAVSRAEQEGRLAILRMANEVRQAQKATEAHDAVTVSATQLDIYVDINGDGRPELVRYRLDDGRLERAVIPAEGSQFPYTYTGAPKSHEIVVSTVINGDAEPLFVLDSAYFPRLVVNVNLIIDDASVPLSSPITLQAALAVRSRGVSK